MAILHRALFTWFILLVFLILLCLRLESRTHWNWFIVFIPMWVYDSILLIYVLFHMLSHCKTGLERMRGSVNRHMWYMAAIGLKMTAQIMICIKLEFVNVKLPIYVVMAPIWFLLPVLCSEPEAPRLKCRAFALYNTEEITMELDLQTCSAHPIVATVGSTISLDCPSNDDHHIFKFWQFGGNHIIGPGNDDYDENKYKYEVLSGKLYIKNFLPSESGCYNCISQKIDGTSHTLLSVGLVTNTQTHEALQTPFISTLPAQSSADIDQSSIAIEYVKLVTIIVSLVVIIGCAVIYWRLQREWNKYNGRIVVPFDDEDEEETDEIYNRTTTAINPAAGPSRNASSEQLKELYGIDNQGLDTDFNSVFQQIQIKAPQQSLI